MGWLSKSKTHQEVISQTGFIVSVMAYLWFWLADIVKPGLVSNYMSVHWWLLVSLAFGLWWIIVIKEVRNRPIMNYLVALFIGIVLAILTWNIGLNLEEYRFMAILIALILPMAVVGVLRSSD